MEERNQPNKSMMDHVNPTDLLQEHMRLNARQTCLVLGVLIEIEENEEEIVLRNIIEGVEKKKQNRSS